MHTMKWAFWMTGNYGDHPDDGFDRGAVPLVNGISYSDIVAVNVTTAARLEGIPGAPFKGICISNATIEVVKSKKAAWTCTDVEGTASCVSPEPCEALSDGGDDSEPCPFPSERLPIDLVELKECSAAVP